MNIRLMVLLAAMLSTFLLAWAGEGVYVGVISDGHSHLEGKDTEPEAIIAAMDRNNVDRVVVWPKLDGGWSDEDALEFQRKHPGRVIAGIAFQQDGWRKQQPDFMAKVRKKAMSGKYGWLGEASFRGKVGGKLYATPESAMWRQLQDIAAESGLPVTVHHNPYKKSKKKFKRTGEYQRFVESLSYNPKAKVIWAHWCGLSAPRDVRKLLARFPNVHCDFAWLFKDQDRYPNPLVDEDHNFTPEWIKLIEDYPDRFLVGVDVGGTKKKMAKYDSRAGEIRTALSGLRPETARKVASQNFHRLIKRK